MTRKGTIVSLCTVLVSFVSAPAFGKETKKKDTGPEHKSGLMEEGEKDPAETEGVDEDAQFIPGKNKKKQATEAGSDQGDGAPHEAGAPGAEDEKKAAPEPEQKTEKPRKARTGAGVFAEALIGFGSAPVPGGTDSISGDFTTGKATTYGLMAGGYFDVSSALRLMLRVPWTTGTFKALDTQDHATSAFGNPELSGRYRLTDPGDTEWAVRLALGIPVAQGSPDFTDKTDPAAWQRGRLQTIADAASGWHDPELYATKRLPIAPAVTFTHRVSKLRLNAELKAVIMPKMGGSIANPQPSTSSGQASQGTLSLNSTAFTAVLGGSGSYEVLTHVHLSLSAWLAWLAAPQVAYDSSAVAPSPFQFVIEPRLFAQFGHVVPSAGFLIPLGGQLGGNINGVRLHVDVVF